MNEAMTTMIVDDRENRSNEIQKMEGKEQRLGVWQLWGSLPKPCKLFLGLCIVQACVSGAFAVTELSKEDSRNLQDLILLLVSAVMFLCIVLDAFWLENAYQLLVSMASGGLNLAQLIIYSTSLKAGRDTVSITVAIVCALLQVATLSLTRWAYLGFGWRMYSKIAGDMRLPNIDRCRRASLRRDRFVALAKLDVQLMTLLLIVGVINGINPGADSYLPSLLVASTVGVVAVALWLTVCCIAVMYGKPRLALFAEFSHPFSYIVAAAYMFSSVYYGNTLVQIHGQAYLLAFPVFFLFGRTFVWWDARLLSGSDLAILHRDLYGKLPDEGNKVDLWKANTQFDNTTMDTAGGMREDATRGRQRHAKVPSALLPLIHGEWLLKLPSNETNHGIVSSKSFNRVLGAFNVSSAGKWRFFQLSHDGSTLRWDWRKYVLLMHVESVLACTENLTITLKFTLEPDLRLKCRDMETHEKWARGLTLVVMLLGNPDGLEGREMFRKQSQSLKKEPHSPTKLLSRLTSGSWRPSAAGLLTKEALQAAASKARKAFSDQTDSTGSSDGDGDDTEYMSSCKPRVSLDEGEGGTPAKHFSVIASAGRGIHRRRGTPQTGNDTLHSPIISNRLSGAHSLQHDIELGLTKTGGHTGSGTVTPRHGSFTYVGDSPSKIGVSRRHENLLFEGRRSSFSNVDPHRLLHTGNTNSPSSTDGQHPVTQYKRSPSPLRRGGAIESMYKSDSLDATISQYAPHSEAWQMKFDAGMAYADSTTTDGSQSQVATPLDRIGSLTRNPSINVEMIEFSQLTFGKMLGQGVEGPVYAAWYQETPVAVKRASCQSEIDIHLHAGWHDNVVNLRGLAHNVGHTYLIMELCPRGTLDMLIHKGASSTIDPTKLLPIARSIARGMHHLHRRLPPIFHRDLKPANIFIGHGFVMKIGDFGMARYAVERQPSQPVSGTNYTNGGLDRTLTPGVIGTAAYSAPEILSPTTPKSGESQDPGLMLKADVYSFGVILWELLERRRPFGDMDGFQIQTQWIIDPEMMRFKAPSIPPGLDQASQRAMSTLCELVTLCTQWNPEDRPDFHVILSKIKDASGESQSPRKNLVSPF
ncbi:Mitogen-activated protein kinase kinase kinase 20 [Picochlorum sp. SENEW3]|nr:Mitogen-activated protein kinase kinase kinase 20 [Picochlorum sp. SENEW3]